MSTRKRRACLILAAFLFFCLPAAAGAAARLTSVTSTVTGQQLPPLVQQRMQESVRVLSEQVLLGHPVRAAYPQEAALIREIFDKLLVGYTVQQVQVTADATGTAAVQVALLPWSDVIDTVQVETQVEGMPPAVEQLVRQDLSAVDEVFRASLQGLPVAATDWTNGILKRQLNAYLASHLPEFRGDFDLVPQADGSMLIKLTVFPRLPVVRTIDLSMRSDTIPNFTLLSHRDRMQQRADMLVGVPVAFVARHQRGFEAMLAETLDALPDARQIHLRTQVHLTPGERLGVMSRSDTRDFRLRLTGWLDTGRSDNSDHDLMFRLHAGSMLSQQDEFFALCDIYPQDVDWDWQLGWRHWLSSKGTADVRYDMRGKRFLFAARQQILPRWWLRYEYRCLDSTGEAAVGYKLHDFLSLELLKDRDDNWLRLIGNF